MTAGQTGGYSRQVERTKYYSNVLSTASWEYNWTATTLFKEREQSTEHQKPKHSTIKYTIKLHTVQYEYVTPATTWTTWPPRVDYSPNPESDPTLTAVDRPDFACIGVWFVAVLSVFCIVFYAMHSVLRAEWMISIHPLITGRLWLAGRFPCPISYVQTVELRCIRCTEYIYASFQGILRVSIAIRSTLLSVRSRVIRTDQSGSDNPNKASIIFLPASPKAITRRNLTPQYVLRTTNDTE